MKIYLFAIVECVSGIFLALLGLLSPINNAMIGAGIVIIYIGGSTLALAYLIEEKLSPLKKNNSADDETVEEEEK